LDLKLFKPNGGKVESLIRGDNEIKRMGVLPYFNAKVIEPGLIPIARDVEEKEGVIYVRKDSGITNLGQLVGKRLAFGDDDATISFRAKVELARAGILGDILHWEHLEKPREKVSAAAWTSGSGGPSRRSITPSSHGLAIEAVLKGDFDAGVGRMQYVQDLTKERLRIIHHFKSYPNFWVASSEVPAEVIGALRQALTEHGPTQIAVGPRSSARTSRFIAIDDSYFDEARQTMTNEVARFVGRRPLQSRPGGLSGAEEEE